MEIDGDMSIGDFLELIQFSDEEADSESATAGGWALEQFGTFPKAGDFFEWNGLKVTVLVMDGLRVEKLLVQRLEAKMPEKKDFLWLEIKIQIFNYLK